MTELVDAIRAGGDIDVIRKGVELVPQALIEAEATEHIGAARYQRTDTRTGQRNGARERLLRPSSRSSPRSPPCSSTGNMPTTSVPATTSKGKRLAS